MLIHHFKCIYLNQNQQFSYFHLNQLKYFQVSNPYKQFHYDEDEIMQDKFIKSKFLPNFQLKILVILNG